MKTTIDIPDHVLRDAMRFTGSRTKRGAVVQALSEFNRRKRMAALIKYSGTCTEMMTPDELHDLRRKG